MRAHVVRVFMCVREYTHVCAGCWSDTGPCAGGMLLHVPAGPCAGGMLLNVPAGSQHTAADLEYAQTHHTYTRAHTTPKIHVAVPLTPMYKHTRTRQEPCKE